MVNPFYFDYVLFEKTLVEDLSVAFADLKQIRGNQSAYCFGIASHAEFENLNPFMLTEEMLGQVVDYDLQDDPSLNRGMNRDNLRWYYRYAYSLVDYDYCISDYLKGTKQLIYDGMRSFDGMIMSARKELPEQEVALIIDKHKAKYRKACVNALQRLNQLGDFGVGTERSKVIVLFVLYGYADPFYPVYPVWDDIVSLNPTPVVQRYRIEKAKSESFDKFMRKRVFNSG